MDVDPVTRPLRVQPSPGSAREQNESRGASTQRSGSRADPVHVVSVPDEQGMKRVSALLVGAVIVVVLAYVVVIFWKAALVVLGLIALYAVGYGLFGKDPKG